MAIATPERETVRAQARYVRCSARKARLVLEHIRGKQAAEAKAILAFATRAAAKDAGKVLASAIANAENNNGYDVDDLVVVAAYADEGPTLKRWRPRARGRVNRIRKRTCHITIQLAVAEPGEIKRPKPRRVAEPDRGGARRDGEAQAQVAGQEGGARGGARDRGGRRDRGGTGAGGRRRDRRRTGARGRDRGSIRCTRGGRGVDGT